MIQTQWRAGFGGRTGLDYNPAIKLIEYYGWDLALALDLLKTVEIKLLEGDAKEDVGQQSSQD